MSEQLPLMQSEEPEWKKYASTEEEILQAVQQNSIQRGAFFLKNLAALNIDAVINAVRGLANSYDMELWREQTEDESLGISQKALEILDGLSISYPYYFCLPDELEKNPRLVLYYRNVAMISNKVMGNVKLDTLPHELGTPISPEKAKKLAAYLNEIVDALVKNSDLLSVERHVEMVLSNLGATLDGGWRNEVGRIAYGAVLTPLIIHLHKKGKLDSVTYKTKGKIALAEDGDDDDNGKARPQTKIVADMSLKALEEWLVEIDEQRVVYVQLDLKNGNRLLLNRQLYWDKLDGERAKIGPDLLTEVPTTEIPPQQYPWAGELKGGADPAGSDEHWKTAKSAFQRIIDAAKDSGRPQPALSFIATILVDRVAREAVLWMQQGKLVSVYNLTKIVNDPALHSQFLEDLERFVEAKTVEDTRAE